MTSVHIVAYRNGKLYSLAVDVEAVWQPLDAGDSTEIDMLPDRYRSLTIGNDKGWSNYEFPNV